MQIICPRSVKENFPLTGRIYYPVYGTAGNPYLKQTKRSEKEVDIKPLIYDWEIREILSIQKWQQAVWKI